MKMEDLIGSLEAYELRILERKGLQTVQALLAQTFKNNGGVLEAQRKEKSR